MAPDDQSHDGSHETHERVILPLLIPAVVFLFAVLAIYGLSRIYLELNDYKVKDVTMATPLAIGVALFILLTASYLTSARRVSGVQIAFIGLVAASLLTAGGVWAAVHEESRPEHAIGPNETPSATAVPGAVSVSLSEDGWVVSADPSSADAGEITFAVTNSGAIIHDFRVAKTELAPDALPLDSDGLRVDEGAVDIVAESPDIDPDASEQVVAQLESGSYVVFCNVPAHYESGMHTAFTVN